MTGKKDDNHETWRDQVDEQGRFYTCKGSEGPEPLADDGQEDTNGEESTSPAEEGSTSQGGLA